MANNNQPAEDVGTVTPRITVYIVSKNYARFLSSAIESVLRQSVNDWELMIIDDGSEDETREVMNLYGGHPQISLHDTGGVGLPSVCNYAMEHAKGRYLIRLDGDDIFDENILLVLANHLDRNPHTALVFPDYYLMDEFGGIIGHEHRAKLFQDDTLLDAPPNGACTMIRTDVLKKIGGYRIDLGAQDGFDLWTRIRDLYKTANINLPLFFYRRHGANLTTNENRISFARREIKKDIARDRFVDHYPISVVIPCRRHFDFVPDLWRQELNGLSLLERDIKTCISSDIIDHVIVTCDNPEAEDYVRKFNDWRLSFHLRSPESTTRTASIAVTLEEIIEKIDKGLNGITVMRYIQTPFVTINTLEEALATLIMTGTDSVIPVEEIKGSLYRRVSHGLEIVNRRHSMTSETEPIFYQSPTCIAARNRNFPRGTLNGATVAGYVISRAESFFISSQHDLEIAGLMVAGEQERTNDMEMENVSGIS